MPGDSFHFPKLIGQTGFWLQLQIFVQSFSMDSKRLDIGMKWNLKKCRCVWLDDLIKTIANIMYLHKEQVLSKVMTMYLN